MCRFKEKRSLIDLSIVILSVHGYFGNASFCPPTAAPLIKDTPFAVIWNSPTKVCKKLEINLEFSAFQAVTTTESEPDQFLFIFYSNRLGLYPYTDYSTDIQYNGGIPQKGNLTASQQKAQLDITQYIPQFNSGLAVIDWEEWRPLWDRNWGSKIIYQKLSIQFAEENDPSVSSSEADQVAKEQFQKAARNYMEETIKLGIKMRPKYLWGFYLFPNSYNYEYEESGYTGDCSEIERSRNNELLWLWNSSTALFPSAYLPLSLKENLNAALFVRGRVKEAVRVAALPNPVYTAPIYVYLRPLFRDQNQVYLNTDDLVRSIGESAALGASGVVIWGASSDYNEKSSCETLAAYLSSTLNPYVANVTAAAKLCSQTLCQSKGRCVRKNSDSNDYLHLNPDNFSIHNYNGKYRAVGVPSELDLNLFVERFRCQCYVGLQCSEKKFIRPLKKRVIIQV